MNDSMLDTTQTKASIIISTTISIVGALLIILGAYHIYKNAPTLETLSITYLVVGIGLAAAPFWLPHVLRLLRTATEIKLPGGAAIRDLAGTETTPDNPNQLERDTSQTQVAAVCYSVENMKPMFLLIRTSGQRWVFPKGVVEDNEEPFRAAEREAFEEAGASGHVNQIPLTRFKYHKHKFKSQGIYLEIDAYLLYVTRTQPSREPHRNPTWFSAEEAKSRLAEDREFWSAEELRRVIDEAFANIS